MELDDLSGLDAHDSQGQGSGFYSELQFGEQSSPPVRPQPKEGPLERLFSGKRKTLKATVVALLEEIKNREDLRSRQVARIEEEIGSRNCYLDHLKSLNLFYLREVWIEINKVKDRLDEDILELEREKRKEHLESWRDLMFLKKYLLSALREYWDLVKRLEMLEDGNLKGD